MPEITNHGKFEVDPNYDRDQDLARTIESAQMFLENKLSAIDQISEPTMQLICMFALLDCLAQERANYPKDSKKAFCEFVMTYQKQCDYMECVEPITLYYHVEDLIEESVLAPGLPPEKQITLGYLYRQPVQQIITSSKAQEILDYIAKQKGTEFAEKKKREHQFISLIYRMRSKAVHEMSGLGESTSFIQHLMPQEPYYHDVARGYVLNGNVVSDDVYELVIPNAFIRNVLQDCVNGYLQECMEQKRFPFDNNDMLRKHRLSWYDH